MHDLALAQAGAPEDFRPAPGFRVSHFLAVLRRRWWVPVFTAAIGLAAGIGYLRMQVPGFVSKGEMWMRGTVRVTEIAQYQEETGNFVGTQMRLMESPQMRHRAMARLRAANPDFKIPTNSQGMPVTASVRVSQVPRSAIFSLECRSEDPEFARLFLDALMEEFLIYKGEIRSATASDVLKSVADQAYKQERNLQMEQEKLRAFQQENNIVLLEEQFRSGGNHLAQLNSQLSMLELELKLLDAVALEKSIGVGSPTNLIASAPDAGRLLGVTTASSFMGAEMSAAMQRLENHRLQREYFGQWLRPKHPKMIALQEAIEREERLLDFLRSQGNRHMATAREAMEIRIESLKSTIEEFGRKMADVNRRYAEYENLKSNIARQQSLYEQLLTLLRSVDLNRNLDQESFAILQRARPATSTMRPAPPILAGGFAVGLLAGLGLVFLLARLDDRCDSMEDVRAEFSEEVFGQIPEVRRRSFRRAPKLLQLPAGSQGFAESCRSLRSTLLFAHRNGSTPRTIVVTSALPEEGKSTIALNLAQTLSTGGARVLLVDADLRRGRLHNLVDKTIRPGLADLIREAGDPLQYILATDNSNLSLLPRGNSGADSAELFLSPAFDRFLDESRRLFDYVIFDTVPVFAAADVTTLAPKVDGVLFIVRRAFTSSRVAQEALDMLYQRRARVLGIVFNRANSESRSYRYYKYAEYYANAQAT